MAFQLKATGFAELKRNLEAITREMINPEAGIAEALDDGAQVIVLQAKDNAVAQGLFRSGDLIDSIESVKVNQFRVDVRVGVVYGAAHEFGVTVAITPRQRRFFWAMLAKTGDPMWRAMALSQTYTIPARPYLRPAIDEAKTVAMHVAARSAAKQIKAVVKPPK